MPETRKLLSQQHLPDQDGHDPVLIEVARLMSQIGYTNGHTVPEMRSQIRAWILTNVGGAQEFAQPLGFHPNNMLWFLASRQMGKTQSILDLTRQLEGSHLVLGPQYVAGGGPFRRRNNNNFHQFSVVTYAQKLPLSIYPAIDYIWVDEWCSYARTSQDWEELFALELHARQVTLIGTPGINQFP